MGRSRRVVARGEPARQGSSKADGIDGESECRGYLNPSFVNGDLVEPDNMAVIILDRGSVVIVRVEMTMRDARVVGRISLVNMFRRTDPRAQHRDGGQQMNGSANRTEHRAIMFGPPSSRQTTSE